MNAWHPERLRVVWFSLFDGFSQIARELSLRMKAVASSKVSRHFDEFVAKTNFATARKLTINLTFRAARVSRTLRLNIFDIQGLFFTWSEKKYSNTCHWRIYIMRAACVLYKTFWNFINIAIWNVTITIKFIDKIKCDSCVSAYITE